MSEVFWYDFQQYVESLRKDSIPEKKEIVEKYEQLVEPLDGKDLKDTAFFRNYLVKFQIPADVPFWYKVPEELKEDFDWNTMARLIAGSFSCDIRIEIAFPDLPRLSVEVENDSQFVKKYIDELWFFQIERLFEIYVEEQLSLESLRAEDDYEKEIIDRKRERKMELWQKEYERIRMYLEYLSLEKTE
jgi:hypothetical protein